MSGIVYDPPRVIVPIFNNYDYTFLANLLISPSQADLRYLYRVLNDTASGRINFAGGMRMPVSPSFPPVVMTSNTAPSPYVASASSVLSGLEPFRLFTYTYRGGDSYTSALNYNPSTGIYTGAVSTSITLPTPSTYFGEWVQIQLPTAIILRRFVISPRSDGFWERLPTTFVVLGSNDGSTWETLYNVSNYNYGNNVSFTYFSIPSPTTAYRYYRLVANILGENAPITSGRNTLNFSNWFLYDSLIYNSLYFTAETNTGLLAYRSGDINFDGTMILNSFAQSFLNLRIPNSTGISLVNNSTLGMWSPATNVLSFGTIGGQELLRLDATAVSATDYFARAERFIHGSGFTSTIGTFGWTMGSTQISFFQGATLRSEITSTVNRFNNQNLDMKANNLVNASQVGNSAGNLEVRVNNTATGGTLTLTGGTGLLATNAGGSAGQHLVITINGVIYKIALQTV